MPKKGDACYSVPISENEFRMLSAFNECVSGRSTGRVDERELQEAYSKQYRKEYPFLHQLHIKEIRDVLDEMCKIGIFRKFEENEDGQQFENTEYELYAIDRGCNFEMIVGD